MTVIDAIRERHSVRSYSAEKIEQEKLDLLRLFVEARNEEGDLHMQVIEDAGKTFHRFQNKASGLDSAPSVIACVGTDDETLDERIGYYGEQVVIYAQQLGLNTCWTGTFSARHLNAQVWENERLVIAIAVGYGNNRGRPHKSKTLEQVTPGPGEKPYWFNFGVELALLAPTAMNRQRFTFRILEDGNVVADSGEGRYSKVELGIIEFHFNAGVEYIQEMEMR